MKPWGFALQSLFQANCFTRLWASVLCLLKAMLQLPDLIGPWWVEVWSITWRSMPAADLKGGCTLRQQLGLVGSLHQHELYCSQALGWEAPAAHWCISVSNARATFDSLMTASGGLAQTIIIKLGLSPEWALVRMSFSPFLSCPINNVTPQHIAYCMFSWFLTHFWQMASAWEEQICLIKFANSKLWLTATGYLQLSKRTSLDTFHLGLMCQSSSWMRQTQFPGQIKTLASHQTTSPSRLSLCRTTATMRTCSDTLTTWTPLQDTSYGLSLGKLQLCNIHRLQVSPACINITDWGIYYCCIAEITFFK